ncbi:MAG: glycosyltransferase family 4 protein [Acidimicrobiia bacterium]
MLHSDLRLLVFNLATDEADPLLAFTTKWVEALAERTRRVHVVTMREGPHRLPANVTVHSLGKEKGYSEPRRVVEFYRSLRAVRRDGVDVCFSHMMPLFTVMAGPLLKVDRVPIATWYAHPKVSNQLRLAHRVSDRMVASVPSAYPYRHDKLVVTGQGIDTRRFAPGPPGPSADDPPLVLYVGRVSPAKDVRTLVRAAAVLKRTLSQPFTVGIVGGPAVPTDEDYLSAVRADVAELGLQDTVWFHPLVPFEELPDWYRRAAVFVNLSPTGFGDKVAWEAMACGVPSVLANEGFADTLGPHRDDLLFGHGDADDLAARLARLLTQPAARRRQIGDDLRAQVIALHEFEQLADRLVRLFLELHERARPAPAAAAGSGGRR